MATIPTDFLFRFRFSCRRWEKASPGATIPETLDASFRIPLWSQIARSNFWDARTNESSETVGDAVKSESLFDFRLGWSQRGLVFTTVVSGKRNQPYWTHSSLNEADSVRFCVDTRDLRDSHRGNRFCHKFAFYPFIGESEEVARPLAQWLPINRAREIPTCVDVDSFVMRSERRSDGYAFSVFIPASSLNGFDPESFDRLGMHYTVADSEYGMFTLQHGAPLPYEDDPSLWSSFVMLGAARDP